MTFLPSTDDPDRFAVGSPLVTDRGLDLVIRASRPYRDRGLILAFEGIKDRNAAEELRGSLLTIALDDRRELGEDEFWTEDLVGLEVVDPDGMRLGEVVAVDLGAAQDRLVVRTDEGDDVLVPFVDEIVSDPVDGRLVVDAPAGLFG